MSVIARPFGLFAIRPSKWLAGTVCFADRKCGRQIAHLGPPEWRTGSEGEDLNDQFQELHDEVDECHDR
jgi:hypothetical protein